MFVFRGFFSETKELCTDVITFKLEDRQIGSYSNVNEDAENFNLIWIRIKSYYFNIRLIREGTSTVMANFSTGVKSFACQGGDL